MGTEAVETFDAIADMEGIKEACLKRQAERDARERSPDWKVVSSPGELEGIVQQARETVANVTADLPEDDGPSTDAEGSGIRIIAKGTVEVMAEPFAKEESTKVPCSPGQADGNPKDAIGSTKVPLSLVPPIATLEESLALLEGLLKYGAHNYRGIRVRASIYMDAAARHEAKYRDGESRDPETGIHHLGYARACHAILIDAEMRGMLIDDRPPAALDLSARMEAARGTVAKLQDMYGKCAPKHWKHGDTA